MLKEKLGLPCCSFAMIWKASRKVQKFLGKSSTTICFLHFFSTVTWPGIWKWKQSKISSLHTKVAVDRSAQSQTTAFKKLFKHLKMLEGSHIIFTQGNYFLSLTKPKLIVLGLNSSWGQNTLVLEQLQNCELLPRRKHFVILPPTLTEIFFIIW